MVEVELMPTDCKETRAANLALNAILDESMLAALSIAVGAREVPLITKAETSLLVEAPDVPCELIGATLGEIEEGGDPLGEAFCQLRPAMQRRENGAVYTPPPSSNLCYLGLKRWISLKE